MSIQEIIKKKYVENDSTLCFKTTSVAKVIVLSIVTCGIYDIILSINYWKSLKENFGYKDSPFVNGLFNVFTNFILFPIFAKYFKTFNIKLAGAGWLAGLYFICSLIDNQINYITLGLEDTNWALEITSLILCIVTTLVFVFIQSKINKINEQYYPNAPKNLWKLSNTIWTIICLILLILNYLPI